LDDDTLALEGALDDDALGGVASTISLSSASTIAAFPFEEAAGCFEGALDDDALALEGALDALGGVASTISLSLDISSASTIEAVPFEGDLVLEAACCFEVDLVLEAVGCFEGDLVLDAAGVASTAELLPRFIDIFINEKI
jgi:hypothetical protein